MNKILDTKLLEMLTRESLDNADSQAALEEFTSRLYCLCKADADYASLYRTLTCTRIQIEQISDALRSKKKCAGQFAPTLCRDNSTIDRCRAASATYSGRTA